MNEDAGLEIEKGGEPVLVLLKDELQQIRTEIGSAVASQRTTNANTRFCKWDGQSDDGRKRKVALGRDARPFEGASDSRIRLADKVINERRDEYLAAALRATPRAVGTGGEDERTAAKVSNLMKWLIRNQWGSRYRQELELLAQWMEGDSPALAVLAVWWEEETRLERRKITRDDMLGMLMPEAGRQESEVRDQESGEAQKTDPEMVAQMVDLLLNPLREAELAAMLGMLEPGIPAGRLKTMARELQMDGETVFPAPYTHGRIPRPEALRVWEDVFFRANVTDLQRAPLVVVRRWLTWAEVLEWKARDGWSGKFTQELKGKEAQSALDELTNTETNETLESGVQARRGLYEVLWGFRRAANKQGAIGIYVNVFSGLCEVAAKAEELLDYQHGEYPFIACPRERLTRRLSDTRSMSELTMTQQASLKLVNDSLEDHVQVMTNPPIKKPKGAVKYSVVLAPFGEIEEDNPRRPIEFLQRPPYPEAADKHWDRIQTEVDDYAGRENEKIPPNRAMLARQIRTDKFLGYLSDGLMMGFGLLQQYWTDEDFMRIAQIRGMPRSAAEIRGRFDLAISFDVRDLDQEYLLKKAETLLKYVRPLDTRAQLPYGKYVKQIVEAIDPNWGDMADEAEEADARVMAAETDAYVQIQNGVEPAMPELIENPNLRLERIKQLHMPRVQNPQAFAPPSAAAQALLENRVKYLQQQAAQVENATIGRIGAKPVELAEVEARA
jgi:hypothetical protein